MGFMCYLKENGVIRSHHSDLLKDRDFSPCNYSNNWLLTGGFFKNKKVVIIGKAVTREVAVRRKQFSIKDKYVLYVH